MMENHITCPLCSQPGFSDVDALRLTLITATTRRLVCPLCQDIVLGLDKLTIHLVSHSLHDHLVRACLASNLTASPLTLSKNDFASNQNVTEMHMLDVSQPSVSAGLNQDSRENVASYILINLPSSGNNEAVFNQSKTLVANNQLANQCIPTTTAVSESEEIRPSNGTIMELNVSPLSASQSAISGQIKYVLAEGSSTEAVKSEHISSGEPASPAIVCTQDSHAGCDLAMEKSFDEISLNEPTAVAIANAEETGGNKRLPFMTGEVFPQNLSNLTEQNISGTSPCDSSKCDLCGLTFRDLKIATLHKQFVHSQSLLHFEDPSQNVEKRNSSKMRPRKSVLVAGDGQGTSSLHQFPCHMCPKVFRMRGSLMIHMRVAHTPTTMVQSAAKETCYTSPLPIANTQSCFGFKSKQAKTVLNSTSGPPSSSSIPVYSREDKIGVQGPGAILETSENVGVPSEVERSENVVSPFASPVQSPISEASPLNNSKDLPNEGSGLFSCSTCNKTFCKESLLSQHVRSHEGKQWECDVCTKLFTTKYFLKKHKRLHTGEMPYTCGICNKSFTFQQSYHKHLLYHSDEKPHTCSECGRAFKELSTLHNHQRIHTGEKPWACETCGKCFRQRVSYLVHRRIHTGAMPYQCTSCLKSFRYKVSQRTHKCTAQPPGNVVHQPEDLFERLLSDATRQGKLSGSLGLTFKVPHEGTDLQEQPVESQRLLREHLQQLNISQECDDHLESQSFQQQLDLKRGFQQLQQEQLKDKLSPSKLGMSLASQQCSELAQQKYCNAENPTNSGSHGAQQPGQQQWSTVPYSTTQQQPQQTNYCHQFRNKTKEPSTQLYHEASSSNSTLVEINKTTAAQPGNLNFIGTVQDQPACSSLSQDTDTNAQLLQDILSMVMSPSTDSPSPSSQMRTLSLSNTDNTSENDRDKFDWDMESGSELRRLLYGPYDSDNCHQ